MRDWIILDTDDWAEAAGLRAGDDTVDDGVFGCTIVEGDVVLLPFPLPPPDTEIADCCIELAIELVEEMDETLELSELEEEELEPATGTGDDTTLNMGPVAMVETQPTSPVSE